MAICLLFKLKVSFFDNYFSLGKITKYKCKLFFGSDSTLEKIRYCVITDYTQLLIKYFNHNTPFSKEFLKNFFLPFLKFFSHRTLTGALYISRSCKNKILPVNINWATGGEAAISPYG